MGRNHALPLVTTKTDGSPKVDVYVTETKYGPEWIYDVWVDGKMYDRFYLRFGPPLTWSQQWDVAEGYREGLSW